MKPYSHRNSPKKFTQHQLFALLVLKEFHNTTYRGVCGILKDSSELREAIELRHTPHWTTIQKAGERLLKSPHVERLISETVNRAIASGKMKEKPKRIAIDTSGFEATSTSRYYARRRKKAGKTAPFRCGDFLSLAWRSIAKATSFLPPLPVKDRRPTSVTSSRCCSRA